MAESTPYFPVVNPGVQAGDGYSNKAYTPDASSQPPPYPQNMQYPSPQPGRVGYYPNQYPPGLVGYAPQPYPQQNQQTATVVITSPQPPVVVQQAPHVSYCGWIVFACFVFWLCNWLFGLIAFILAVVAENTKTSDPDGARKLGKASMWLSIVGIIVTVLIVAIAIGVSASNSGTSSRVSTSNTFTTYFPRTTQRFVSPYTCCSSISYTYPGSGIYCYSSVYSYSYYSCPSYYYYDSTTGNCYRYRSMLSSSLCCYSYEWYSTSTNYCYS